MKRTTSLFFVLAMLLSILPVSTAVAVENAGVSINKADYDLGEEIIITFTGVTAEMVSKGAYVTIVEKDAALNDYGTWKRVPVGDSVETSFYAPLTAGDYEVRFYAADPAETEDDMIIVPFTSGNVMPIVPTVSLDKANYGVSDNIVATVTGITQKHRDNGAWISISREGDRLGGNLYWHWFDKNGSNVRTFDLQEDLPVGFYEMRVHQRDADDLTLDEVIVAPFTVGNPTRNGDEYVEIPKTSYKSNETILVKVSGITEEMVDRKAYVSIYKSGAAHTEFGSWDRVAEGMSLYQYSVTEPGLYEMRLYRRERNYGGLNELTDEDVISVVPFSVGLPDKAGTISLDKTSYAANSEIAVTVNGITEEMETALAWVGVYPKGAAHTEWGAWTRVPAGDSVQKLNAINKNGEYEMRLYTTDYLYSDMTLVMSVEFTITGATSIEGRCLGCNKPLSVCDGSNRWKLGDAEGNCSVTVNDAVQILMNLAKNPNSTVSNDKNSDSFLAADCSKNGVIDVADAVQVLMYLAKNPTSNVSKVWN